MDSSLFVFDRFFMFYTGIGLLVSGIVVIFWSLIGSALRDIALNTARGDRIGEKYSLLDWICSFGLYGGAMAVVLAIFMVFKSYFS